MNQLRWGYPVELCGPTARSPLARWPLAQRSLSQPVGSGYDGYIW